MRAVRKQEGREPAETGQEHINQSEDDQETFSLLPQFQSTGSALW